MQKKLLAVLLAAVAITAYGCGNNASKTTEEIAENAAAAADSRANADGDAKYNYTPGVLNTVTLWDGEPVVDEFHIDGLQIYSGLDGEESELALKNTEYKTEGIKANIGEGYTLLQADLGDKDWAPGSDYYNELQRNLQIVIAPHKPMEEYEKMSQEERLAYWNECEAKSGANQNCPLSMDGKPRLSEFLLYIVADESMRFGEKDILFIWKGKIAQFIVVNYMPEKEFQKLKYRNDFGNAMTGNSESSSAETIPETGSDTASEDSVPEASSEAAPEENAPETNSTAEAEEPASETYSETSSEAEA